MKLFLPQKVQLLMGNALAEFNGQAIVLFSDLNWDWLTSASDGMKNICDEINLSQLVNFPMWPNHNRPEKSTLIDLIRTNIPHKYAVGVFCNDLRDHCVVLLASWSSY